MGFVWSTIIYDWKMGWSNEITSCSYMVCNIWLIFIYYNNIILILVLIVLISHLMKVIKNYDKNWFKQWKWVKPLKVLIDYKKKQKVFCSYLYTIVVSLSFLLSAFFIRSFVYKFILVQWIYIYIQIHLYFNNCCYLFFFSFVMM